MYHLRSAAFALVLGFSAPALAEQPAGSPSTEAVLDASPWLGVSAEGRRVLEQAAAGGDPRAMSNLAVAYANGHGGAQDHARARHWYERAAKARSAHGVHGLGLLTYNGEGGPKDEVLGLALLQLAISANEIYADDEQRKLLAGLDATTQGEVDAAKAQWIARHGRPCNVISGMADAPEPWFLDCEDPVTSAREP